MNKYQLLQAFHKKIKTMMILKVYIHMHLRVNCCIKEKVIKIKIDQKQQEKIIYLKNNKYKDIKNQIKTKKVC
jgi:ribosomal protein S26